MSLFSTTPAIDHDRVVAAIGAAEKRTSGEIRVLLAKHQARDPVASAKRHFERLGMTKTAARNGVLIFLAPASRTFAVIGDTGVHEKCGEGFWTELAKTMTEHFKRGEFTAGLVHGIERAGALLAEHFPRQADDVNELPDEIEEA
ncbi:MAG TPA: TPM domain-containing protein [Opitutus sp.]|nr:TPM domain-containing protein [Opitutus sp.]